MSGPPATRRLLRADSSPGDESHFGASPRPPGGFVSRILPPTGEEEFWETNSTPRPIRLRRGMETNGEEFLGATYVASCSCFQPFGQ